MDAYEAAEKLRQHGDILRKQAKAFSDPHTRFDSTHLKLFVAHALTMFGDFKNSQADLYEELAKVADFQLEVFKTPAGDAVWRVENENALNEPLETVNNQLPIPPFEADFFNRDRF